jgi:hypothetical protein
MHWQVHRKQHEIFQFLFHPDRPASDELADLRGRLSFGGAS